MSDPKLSLVTGTLNRPVEFRRLVDSIITNTTVDWELIVSDASDFPTEPIDERITILEERPRLGYCAAYNRAFAHCRGEFVIFLNDDARVCAHYDVNAIAFMERNPQIGLGALYYSNQGQPFAVNIYAQMIYANFGILRRSLGEQLGWFWSELRMYGTDNALAFDVLLAGLGVAGIENARIIHDETADAQREFNQINRCEGADALQAKYSPRWEEMKAVYHRALMEVR